MLAVAGALLALAYLGWSLSDIVPSAFAHTAVQSDTNNPLAMRAPWGIPFLVTVHTSGHTREYRDGPIMVMDYHYNFVNIPNGRCGQVTDRYPMCFSLVNPHAVYSNSGSSYTLIGSSHWDRLTGNDCLVGVHDMARCWESDTELGWTHVPVDAEMKRPVIITPNQNTAYLWVTCWCGSKMITNEYEVD